MTCTNHDRVRVPRTRLAAGFIVSSIGRAVWGLGAPVRVRRRAEKMATPVYSNNPFVTILSKSYMEQQVASGRSFESLSPNAWKMYKSPKAPSETDPTDDRPGGNRTGTGGTGASRTGASRTGASRTGAGGTGAGGTGAGRTGAGRTGPSRTWTGRSRAGRTKAKKSKADGFERAAFRIVQTVRGSLDTCKTDIFKMVRAAVDFGNDLLLPQVNMSDAEYDDFNRIKRTYGLVRNSHRLPRTVNLITVAEMFPVVACMYAHYFARNTIVPYTRMAALCPFYPKVMMTSAFSKLLPMNDEPYCIYLLNAHLLHQYEYELIMVDPEVRAKADNLPIPFEMIVITNVTCYTEEAARQSRVGYMEQIKFMVAYDLVEIENGKIVAAQNVIDAAKAWEEVVHNFS